MAYNVRTGEAGALDLELCHSSLLELPAQGLSFPRLQAESGRIEKGTGKRQQAGRTNQGVGGLEWGPEEGEQGMQLRRRESRGVGRREGLQAQPQPWSQALLS